MTRSIPAIARLIALASAAAIAASACAGSSTGSPGSSPAASAAASVAPATPSDDAPASPASPAVSPSASASTGAASSSPSVAPPALTQAWATATLTDVETGEPFRIADLAGRTVFVEAMAIWCTKCRAQQGEFATALAELDPETVAYVVLTVEPSETAEGLARYESDQGFSGRYAVAGREVSAALEADFGPTVLIPPNVPVIVIAPDGTVTFMTGQHSAEDIVALVEG